MMQWSKTLLLGASLCAVTGISQAKQVMCVFDLVGKSGDVFSLMKDYQLAAKNWGADIELRVNTNEAVVAEDFKAGKCDGISVTGMRGRYWFFRCNWCHYEFESGSESDAGFSKL